MVGYYGSKIYILGDYMGAITEMMLEGILCDKCAGFIDENPVGYPRTCKSCLREYEKEDKRNNKNKLRKGTQK